MYIKYLKQANLDFLIIPKSIIRKRAWPKSKKEYLGKRVDDFH